MEGLNYTNFRQTREWALYMKETGWWVETIGRNNTFGFGKHIPLLGNFIKIQRPNQNPTEEEIKHLLKNYDLVKLEPKTPVTYGLGKINLFPLSPTKTIAIKLMENEETVFSHLSKNTRQTIKHAKNQKLLFNTIKPSADKFEQSLLNLYQLIYLVPHNARPTYERLQILAKCFLDKCFIAEVYKDGSVLSSALILISDNAGFYYLAGTSKEGRRLGSSYLLLWEVILTLKSMGMEWFDLEGLEDKRFMISRGWSKFSVFKRKWGGVEIVYPPSLVFASRPLIKLISPLI